MSRVRSFKFAPDKAAKYALTSTYIFTLLLFVLGLYITFCYIAAGEPTQKSVSRFPLIGPGRIDEHSSPPANIFISSSKGIVIDYCSVTGCLPGPKLLTQTLFTATTQLPAIAQEVGVAFNFTNRTGYAPQWQKSNSYFSTLPSMPARTTDVSSSGNIYRNTVDKCRSSATGRGPTGRETGIADGSCRWDWVSEGLNGAKSAASFATIVEPGGGAAWGRVEDFVVRPAVGAIVAYANEEDCNNENADSSAGSPFFMLCHFQGGGSRSTFPVFAYNYIGSGAVNSGSSQPFGAHNGYFVSGQPNDVGSVVKDAAYADASNSDRVVHALAGRRHATGFLVDESNSDTVLKVSGHHRVGLDLSAGQFGQAILVPPSSLVCLNGKHGACFRYDPNAGTSFFASDPDGTPAFTVRSNGDFEIAGHFRAALRTPRSSSAPCQPGEFVDNEDFHFVCVAQNKWKRTPLLSW